MSVLGEIFAVTTLPVSDLRNPRLWLQDWAGGSTTIAGQEIGPDTAVGLSAYFAALRAISEDVAKLPLNLWRRREERGKDLAEDESLFSILREAPNPDMTSIAFRETLTHHALGWGNGFAEIERNTRQQPINLWPIHPGRVTARRLDSGEIVYDVERGVDELGMQPTESGTIRQKDMLHIHGLAGDGVLGYSIFKAAARSIALGLAIQDYGADFFANGARASGVLNHPETLSDDAQEKLRKQFQALYSGDSRFGVVVTEEGMSWQQLSIPPEDALMIDSINFTVEEMARWFRITPHKLQHLLRATFNNIESLNIQYFVDTLTPWLTRWEQELKRKLLPDDKRLFFKHDPDIILRGDSTSRAKFNRDMFMVGGFSQNDIRDREDENPIDDGDTYYVPSNMTRSEDAARGIVASGEGSRAGPQREPDDNDSRSALFPVFKDAALRVLRKESNAVLKARKRHGEDENNFASWMVDFYAEHEEYIVEAFLPGVASAAESTGQPMAALSERLDAFAADSVEASRLNVNGCRASGDWIVVEKWPTLRAESMAAALMEGLTNGN